MKNLLLLIFIFLFIFGCKEEKPKANVKHTSTKTAVKSDDILGVQKIDYSLYQQYVDYLKKSKFDSIWMSKDSNLFELKITGKYLETEHKSTEVELIFKDLEIYISLYKNSNILFNKTYSFNQFHNDWRWLSPSQLPLEDFSNFTIQEFDEEDKLMQISFLTSNGPTCEIYNNSLLINFDGKIINNYNSSTGQDIYFKKSNIQTDGFTWLDIKRNKRNKLKFYNFKSDVFLYPSMDKTKCIIFYVNLKHVEKEKSEEEEENSEAVVEEIVEYETPFVSVSTRENDNFFIIDDSLRIIYKTKMFGTSSFFKVNPLVYQSDISKRIYFLDDYNDKVLVMDKDNFNRLDSFSFYKKFGKKLTNELKSNIDLDKKGELILKKDKL